MTRILSRKETKSLILDALKEAFPGVKFGARTHRNSLTVHWTDGPDVTRVDRIIQRFASASFDASADLKRLVEHNYRGESVICAFDYLTAERTYTPEFLTCAVKDATKEGSYLHQLGARAEMFAARRSLRGGHELDARESVLFAPQQTLREGRLYDAVISHVAESSADFYPDAEQAPTAQQMRVSRMY